MSRVKPRYHPQVEQVESRQMLSSIPPGYTIPSRAGYIGSIGNGFVGEDSLFTTTKTVYLSSLTNATGTALKIVGVGATFSGRSNFNTTSVMENHGKILFWTQKDDQSFYLKVSVKVDKNEISTAVIFPAGASTAATQFKKPGDAPAEKGWEKVDFPLAQPFKVVAEKHDGKITGITVEPPT